MRLPPVGLNNQLPLLQSFDILGSPEMVPITDSETNLRLGVQDSDALIRSWHKTSSTRVNALSDPSDPKHRRHHRLVLGQYQILANRSRTDNYRQKFLKAFKASLASNTRRSPCGRVSCMQFLFRGPAVIYLLTLDNKVVLPGFIETKRSAPFETCSYGLG